MKWVLVVLFWNGSVWTTDTNGWSPRIQPSKIICEERARYISSTKKDVLVYCVERKVNG